jgi:hypothetical protein
MKAPNTNNKRCAKDAKSITQPPECNMLNTMTPLNDYVSKLNVRRSRVTLSAQT